MQFSIPTASKTPKYQIKNLQNILSSWWLKVYHKLKGCIEQMLTIPIRQKPFASKVSADRCLFARIFI